MAAAFEKHKNSTIPNSLLGQYD